jgi:catechol 2,3-dioxygenase-like lactoylglutathione lyase family enzyme
VLFAPDIEKAEKFYSQRLGFRTVDVFTNLGPFMRPTGTLEHHTLFLIKAVHSGQSADLADIPVQLRGKMLAGGSAVLGRRAASKLRGSERAQDRVEDGMILIPLELPATPE